MITGLEAHGLRLISCVILIGGPFMSFLFWCMSIFRLVSLVVLAHVLVKPVSDYISSYHMFIVSDWFLSEDDLTMRMMHKPF